MNAYDYCTTCHDTRTVDEPVTGRFAPFDSRPAPCPACRLVPEPQRVDMWKAHNDDPWSTGRVDLNKMPF